MNQLEVQEAERLRKFVELHRALQEIRDHQGKVCDLYEVCDHRACESSYAAWAIADAALGTLDA